MQRGFFEILVLALVIIAAVAGGAYYFGTQKGSIPFVSKSSPTPSPSADPTSNWKTYTNTKFNYSLKYPTDWVVAKECPQDPQCDPIDESTSIDSTEKFGPAHEPLQYYLSILNHDNPGKLNFYDLVTGDSKELKEIFVYTTDTINGMIVFRTNTLASGFGCEWAYFQRQDKSFVSIDLCPYNKEDPYQEQERFYNTFNKILTTFKFID